MKEKKTYVEPVVTRVRLEDKKVVAMAACNQLLEFDGNQLRDSTVFDRFGNRLLTFDPSL